MNVHYPNWRLPALRFRLNAHQLEKREKRMNRPKRVAARIAFFAGERKARKTRPVAPTAVAISAPVALAPTGYWAQHKLVALITAVAALVALVAFGTVGVGLIFSIALLTAIGAGFWLALNALPMRRLDA